MDDFQGGCYRCEGDLLDRFSPTDARRARILNSPMVLSPRNNCGTPVELELISRCRLDLERADRLNKDCLEDCEGRFI
jgi:hypothetical protein